MTSQTERHVVKKIGRVKSDRMAKSIVVQVERRMKHPLYEKYITRYTNLMVHDESNDARVGDTVAIVFARPLSKNKRWKLTQVLTRAEGGDA